MPDAEEKKRAKKIAYKFLAYRDRTQEEIRRHLRTKEIPPSAIQEVVADLKELGYVDDQKFAINWGEALIRSKKIGKRRLELELLAKGIASSEVAKAIETLYAEREEWDLALASGRKKWAGLKGLDRQKKTRRLAQFLQRKGFPADIIFKIVDRCSHSE